jgi:amino acid adenylation domain-containing protein
VIQRIELGEIEYAASRTPGCRDVVSDVIKDSLVVFCVSSSTDLRESDIHDTCKKWLPPYMIPTDILIMESMPYLASGKVDRRTLQSLHQTSRESQDSHMEPEANAKLKHLEDLFKAVLKVDVSSFRPLSAAGIDSLSSIRIASKLRDNGYPHVGATDVLEARSLSELHDRLVASDANHSSDLPDQSLLQRKDMQSVLNSHDLLSSHMAKIQDIVACTPVQSAMLSETARNPRAYCNWIELRVDVQRSLDDVEEAIHTLVSHHEMLRTGFAMLHNAQNPYASVIWQNDHAMKTVQVTELDYDYEIMNESQLLMPRQVQLSSSVTGTNVLFQLHHSLYDQWSIDIIKDDLDQLLRGKKLTSQPSYTAVATLHAQKHDQATPQDHIEYWQSHLKQAAPTPLPQLNGQRRSSGLQRTEWRPLDITTSSLRETATDASSSAPAIFQAAYSYLLSLYAGASDVMYGTVFSGRHIPVSGVERIVGPCLSTLPSRTDIDGVRTYRDLIQSVHNQNRGMLKYSDTPLVEVKRLGRYPPNETMFDTLFIWQESTFAKPTFVAEIDSADQHEYNLVLEVEPRSEHVAVRVTYQESRINSAQVDVFVKQLESIAQQLIDNPQALISDLVTCLPDRTLAIDNPHPKSHSHQAGLIVALEDVARQMPSAPALIFGQSLDPKSPRIQSVTYDEMHTRANRLARHLISLDVHPDDLVCVCMDKSIELYVTILAVLKAGAGYLPLLPDTPKDRLKSILDQTSPTVFLCDSTIPDDSRSVVQSRIVDLSATKVDNIDGSTLALPYCGYHAAYSIFTSGSTGTPKGLIVTQDNLLGNLSALADIYPVQPGDRLLQACSQAFDVSVFEIFFAFFTGMPLCFASKDELFQDIERGINCLEITHLSLTPTVATLVDPKNVPCVRFLVTAGEPMTEFVHKKWADKGLHQGYGPSETTNICTVNAQMPNTDIISNIGPAFPNTSAFVIDPNKPFQILPLGAIGELAFGGEQVFRGYIGRDDLNAEKIVSHPVYGRVYRSGDIGRMLPGGAMLISGRLDDQVKVRGNRIELGEINANVLSHGNVGDCTTMVLGKDSATQSIATFWLPTSSSAELFEVITPTKQLEHDVRELFQTLETSLPQYMVPSIMVPVTTLPRTTQGKLDRRRLESVAATLDESAKRTYFRSTGQAPEDDQEWTTMERDLAAALGSVINLPSTDIGRNTSFFALGLNSINAIAYAKAIEKSIGKVISVGEILRNASIARLSSAISSDARPAEEAISDLSKCFSQTTIDNIKASLETSSDQVVVILPCTPLQEAMLLTGSSQIDTAYSNRTTFKIVGDVSRLKQCFSALVSRHAILRTKFFETSEPDHPFAQVVLGGADMPWLDQSEAPSVNGNDARSAPLVTPQHPFHLSVETAGNDDIFLTLHMHHAIYDGASISLLLEEAEMLYNEQALPAAPSFEPFLREVQVHAGTKALNFWSSCLENYTAKPFPVRPESSESVVNGRIEMPFASSQIDLDDFSKRHDVGAASIYQAAWTKVLVLAQGAGDVCFGDVVSGRSVPVANVHRLVAPCFNTIPVRVVLDNIHDNISLIRAVHKQRLAADSYQLTPLRRIQALSKTPDVHLFDALLLVQPPSRDLNADIWQLHEDEGLMDLPLVIEILQSPSQPNLVLHYDGHYLTQSSASMLAHAFVTSLSDCLRFPSSSVRDVAGNETQPWHNILATQLVIDKAPRTSNDERSSENWTEAEVLVRQAFSHFANVDAGKIRRDTSLYRLGLDSLHAVQVASRLRSQGLSVSAADVMEHRTPAALAAAATAVSDKEDQAEFDFTRYDAERRVKLLKPLGIREEAVERLRPCTPAQNGMISQSLHSQGTLYVNHVVYEIPQATTENELRHAWQNVQLKHEALRMGFIQTEEAQCPFAMVIYSNKEVDVPLHTEVRSEAAISAGIVDDIHLPAWRITIDRTSNPPNMILSIHHALYDAESLQVLLRDLASALKGRDLGTSPGIDGILRSMLEGVDSIGSQAEQFWRKSLENSSPSSFPNLNPVILGASDLYAVQRTSKLSYTALESLCRSKGCTIQAAGQTAWALLLSAYIGEAGVTFGTVFSGRTGSQHESIMFPSLATLPVFCNASEGISRTLSDMTDFNGTAQRHKNVPLSDLQRFANLPGQSLFDTVFVYQKSSNRLADDFTWRLVKESAAVDYNVSLELGTTSTEVSLTLTVNRGVVPEEHANLLVEQYDHMLMQVLREDSSSISPSEQLYSATPARFPSLPSPVQLLHQFVEEGASRTPDRPALEFAWDLSDSPKSRKIWSYRELNDRANQVAHTIQDNGAKSGDIIAVCMHKCPEASFAFVGILKAGCAFLALDPELPQARKEFILRDSGATVLIVDETNNLQDSDVSAAVITISESILDAFPRSPVDVGLIDPQATCYCLYTSGTTGTPKGCELTHENAVQAMMAFQKLFSGRWNEKSRWLQFASYWFDVSVLEQFWSWSVGITLVGAPRDLVLDDITLFIQRMHITHIDLTPSLARILDPEDVPSLWDGVFITGGEALKQEIIEKWGSHRAICNGYGPTEATIGVTMNPFIGPDAKASNIGPSFLNVGSYVFTPGTTNPVLRGAVGELCVSGKLVGKGYLNRPELTAKAFPVLEDTGEKIYRTGDLVRQLADGSFLFIGRQDSQAKLRGQRLEIDEIDSVIKSSTNTIADYASLVIKSGDRETLVTFFITAVRKQTPDLALDASEKSRSAAQVALEACRSRLPGYMVPTHILPLNVIPLTVNNKIDAKRLTAFYNNISVSALQSIKGNVTSTRALGPDAMKICKVLENMLSVDIKALDSSTNIFSLGMSSVSAITFATLLKRAGFSGANVASIMRNPTIGELEGVMQNEVGQSQDLNSIRQAQMSIDAFGQRYRSLAVSRLAIAFEDIELVAPCTPLQQGLILESFRNEQSPYFNDFTFIIDHLDIARLRQAFQQVAQRVQPLRTKFMQTDDGYAQVVLKHQELPWYHDKYAEQGVHSASEQRRQQWLSHNEAELVSPCEISIAENAQTYLTVHIHHALYDGISFDMIMERVAQSYHDQTIDCGPDFTKALAYGPLRSVKDADVFWKQQLGIAPSRTLPLSAEASPTGDQIQTHNFKEVASLNDICKKLGVSHQAVAQACFAVALHELAPELSVYGTVVSGRSFAFEHADQVLGPLFNTLPNPLNLQSDDTWTSLVQRCHSFNVAALPFQHTPLRDIKKWCKRSPSDPVFDAMFVFQNLQVTGTSSASSIWKAVETAPRAEYPLAFELELDFKGGLKATVVSKGEIATSDMLQTMLQSFGSALDLIEQAPEQRISERFRVSLASIALTDASNGPGQQTPYLNGVHNFTWTTEARKIRSEIATLASLEEDEIDEHSTIFSLGLDSIDAVKLTSRLKRAGMSTTVSALIRAQTIPRILSSLQPDDSKSATKQETSRLREIEQKLSSCLSSDDSVDQTTVERILPATPSQEALISEMVRSDFREYYNHDVLCLGDDIDFERLLSAWELVVRQSPILRTSFVEVISPDIDAVYAQVIHMPQKLEVARVELPDASKMDDLLEAIGNEVKLSLSRSPPTRLTVVTVASARYLVLSLAHAQYDGHSLALIHQDVEDAYLKQSVNARPLADTLIEASLAAVDSQALAFWRNNLAGARTHRMPPVNPDGNPDTLHRVEDVCTITSNEARAFCRDSGFSLQALAQCAWALTLAHYTSCFDVIFGAVLACRDSEEAEKVLFPLMNTVPIRATLHGTRRAMVKHMQNVNTDALGYQRTPLRHIQRAATSVVHSESVNDHSTLFDTLFIYQHRPDQTDKQNEPLYESVGGSSNIEFPVAVELEAMGEHMILRAACKHIVLDRVGAQKLLHTLGRMLEAIVRTPDEPTVEFAESRASVCGLPFIRINAEDTVKAPTSSEQESEPEMPAASAEANMIKDALCQVSRTPPGELSDSATIESIGIDSISAIKVVALLRKQGVQLSVGELIRAKTVARIAKVAHDHASASSPEGSDVSDDTSLARYVAQHRLAEVPSLYDIDIDNIQAVFPASPGQTYMLNVWQTTQGQLFYPTFEYHLAAQVTEHQLQGAWEKLVEQHNILRTIFCATSNTEVPIAQVVLKRTSSTFNVGRKQQPSPYQQPMAHLNVVQSSTFRKLKLHIHHALYDAISLPLIMEDFETLLAGAAPTLPSVSYENFLSLSLAPTAQTSRQEFWSEYLSNVNILLLQQPEESNTKSRVEIFKPEFLSTTSALEAAARKEGLTLQSLLFAAYARIYAQIARRSPSYNGGDDVVTGIYLSNRSHIDDLPDLRSPTLNLLPLLVRSASTVSLIESARQIQEDLQLIGTPENSAVGLWEIAKWANVKVDTFVNFQRLPDLLDDDIGANGEAKHELEVVEDERLAARACVVGGDHSDDDDHSASFQPPKELFSMEKHMHDAYLVSFKAANIYLTYRSLLTALLQHSVDLEVTITPSGTMNVGLFCPTSMISLQQAEDTLEALRGELHGL